MGMPIPRPYQQYPSMVNSAPYPMPPRNPTPLQHRPHIPQHAPSSPSVHSHQGMVSPAPSNTSLSVPPSTLVQAPHPVATTPPPPLPATQRMPYYPPLPWYSFPEGSFPSKGTKRRRKKPAPQSPSIPVVLPSRDISNLPDQISQEEAKPPVSEVTSTLEATPTTHTLETPTTSYDPSDTDSTQPTTPSSAVVSSQPRLQPKQSQKSSHRSAASLATIVPAIPNIPLPTRALKHTPASTTSEVSKAIEPPPTNADHLTSAVGIAAQFKTDDGVGTAELAAPESSQPAKTTPKSWADLVRTKAHPKSTTASCEDANAAQTNGLAANKAGSLSEALSSYSVERANENSRVAFLEPRGLVNTGNMCYMNSILQVLVFCVPFYTFLDQVGKRAAHSFKNDTPLMDAMIMFMREFSAIDSAVSVKQLQMRLKDNELEQYGEAFIPEFVYEVIRRLPRFSSMRRGHQQDAEEFLGFILEEMHDECSRTMKFQTSSSGASTPTNGAVPAPSEASGSSLTVDDEWMEVGRKQKAAITRSSGAITTESPITKIFGGKLRSELRVPGMKNSVTLEPYQPLQLDIGAPSVNNIIDALKGLTKAETLHGEFNSPRGPGSNATKQVTIETLPQVLILHLKRFQYDNAGGTQKIWKKVGYPLELEIPKEVFPQHKRSGLVAHGRLPRYRLISVVYHHGKNASGGHYTVDVRRQEGREWIRLDDTIIRRIRSEDVAEGGSEEDPRILAAALEQHKMDENSKGNLYDQLEDAESMSAERGWSQVNGTSSGSSTTGRKWSGLVNGNATPTQSSGKMTPVGRTVVKDNKVAYILFYQKVSG
ncbi:MAG: hypothetical protein Q9191_001725 [Dirinaria sp. TL-2023a]